MSTLYQETLALAPEVQAAMTSIVRRDLDLGRRLKRAMDAAEEHIELAMCSTGRDKRDEYQAAHASLLDALGCIRAAVSTGRLGEAGASLASRLEQLAVRARASAEGAMHGAAYLRTARPKGAAARASRAL